MSAHIITFPSTAIRNRECWRQRSIADRTDWIPIGMVISAILFKLAGASS